MKERLILFTGLMVRAILEGRKTQTRRVVTNRTSQGNYRASELLLDDPRTFKDHGPSPVGNPGEYLHAYVDALKVEAARGWKRGDCPDDVIERLYPRWMPGDRLWVRETAAFSEFPGGLRLVNYRATPDGETAGIGWKPSIHMPRWASRLTLEVKAVRVERLQEIGEADAIAEGAEERPAHGSMVGNLGRAGHWQFRQGFRDLWDSINAKRGHGWVANPWVWVVEFKRVAA